MAGERAILCVIHWIESIRVTVHLLLSLLRFTVSKVSEPRRTSDQWQALSSKSSKVFLANPWISTLEDQFARDDYSDMDKLALAVYFLGGKAESFVHQREEIKYFETWDELKSSLIRMFGERDDPERIRLQTERDISTHNWLVSLKIRNADAIQEMWMPISSVSESQVESASVPAKLLDEHRIIPQNESIQVLNPNLESSLTKED